MNLKNIFKGGEEGGTGILWVIILPTVIGGLFVIFSLSLILTNKIDFLYNLYNNNPITYLSIAIPLIGGFWTIIVMGLVLTIVGGGDNSSTSGEEHDVKKKK